MDSHDAVALAQALIRCPSVTPHEAGALTLLESVLEPAGFECHRLTMTEASIQSVPEKLASVHWR
jgi:succinyl-diaminopimelate desuccinylase